MPALFNALFNHRLRVSCGLFIKLSYLNTYFFEKVILAKQDEFSIARELVLLPLLQSVDNTNNWYVWVSFL